jgi:KDO2-lipid IV(A) lauroyltransferase
MCVALPDWVYNLRNAPLRGFTRLLIWLVRLLPRRAALSFGGWLAKIVWVLMPRWRYTSIRNLELLFSDTLSHGERVAIGRQAAVNLGYHVVEFIQMGFLPVDRALEMVVESEGEEHLREALRSGGGVIGLAMHYGNWELSGAYLSKRINPLYAVGKEQRDDFFTKLAFPWRARFDIRNIMAGDKVNSAIVRALRENCVLGLLADQNGGKNGTFAPFGGIEASTVAGPAALALKFGSPLLVVYCRRLSPGRLKFVVKPPLSTADLPAGKDAAIRELLTRINAAYEEVIREDPTQWLWGHKRWKTRPQGDNPLYA